jgi:hypothetical protein
VREAATRAAPLPRAGNQLPRGTRAGPYRVSALRSEGGFAGLYRAVDVRTRQLVALKVLHRHLLAVPQALERLQREARTLNQLSHPHIVQVLDCGELPGGRPFIAMEWLPGRNLDEELERRGGPFSAAETVSLLEPLCAALSAAHERGIVHRDVKAGNVVVGPRVGVKLVDFGVAKLLEREAGQRDLTASQEVVGTPLTMAPEQILGQPVDARTDVYALGLLLHQLLTGRLPFQGRSIAETEELHLQAPIPRVSDRAGVPAGVDDVLRRCLDKSREHRFSTTRELLAALREGVVPGSAPRPELRMGVHVRARIGDAGADPDATLDELAAVLARARQSLEAVALSPALVLADGVLATAPLPPATSDALAFRRRVLEGVLPLTRRAPGPVRLEITAHLAGTAVETRRGRPVLGGELLRVCEWAAGHPGRDLVATAAALAGLEDRFGARPHPRRPDAWILA